MLEPKNKSYYIGISTCNTLCYIIWKWLYIIVWWLTNQLLTNFRCQHCLFIVKLKAANLSKFVWTTTAKKRKTKLQTSTRTTIEQVAINKWQKCVLPTRSRCDSLLRKPISESQTSWSSIMGPILLYYIPCMATQLSFWSFFYKI